MRRLLAVLFLFTPLAAHASFSDVYSGYPNEQAINYVQEQGIVQGYPDGTFRPDNTINRAEFAKIVMATRFSPDDIAACPHRPGRTGNIFPSDVGADQWFSAYVCRAIESGIIRGYPDGTFRPDRAINFVEAAKILSTSQISIELSEVADPWFANYVNAMASKGAIPSSITSFDQFITRGEMAEMIWRLKANITDRPSKTYEDFTQNSESGWRSYRNGNDNFTVSLPQDWEIHLLNKPEHLPQPFSAITGTKFQDPNAQAFVFVALTPTCPDIAMDPSYRPSMTSTTIDGKVFTSVSVSDGAAGSVGEETFYISRQDATHCIFIASFYFHNTGDANDEPQRSIIKKGIIQEKAAIEQIVQSLKFQ